MKIRKLAGSAILLLLVSGTLIRAQTKAAQEVIALLHEFMDGAGRGDRALFDRFFAADVIYTRATGVVITKADIMSSLQKPVPESEGRTNYSAEDITLHEYGDTIVVAFQLVGRTERSGGKVDIAHYRNTGTFVRRDGQWRVVAWQATKIADAAAP